jgi:hypothetical protein
MNSREMIDRHEKQPAPRAALSSAALGLFMLAAIGVDAAFLTPRPDDAPIPVGMPAADLGAALCLLGVLLCTVWLTRGLVRGRRRLGF